MEEGGVLRFFYDTGIRTEIFPILIFIGIGAMTDFGPLLENPKILLLGAAGQFGIFLTLLLALAVGFNKLDAVAVAMIRSFGAWEKLTRSGVWGQRQIKRAIELGLGAPGPHQVELVTRAVSGADAKFERLVEAIRRDLAA